MIVEITGVPCSGKSYFIDRISNNLNSKIKVVKWNNYNLINVFLIFVGYSYLLINNKGYTIFIKYILKKKIPFFDKIKLSFNVIKKITLNWIYSFDDSKIYLFDEGLTHIPFNILVDSYSDDIDIDFCLKTNKKIQNSNLIFLVESDKKDIIKRLNLRGHKRYYNKSFIEQNFKVNNCIKEFYSKCENFHTLNFSNKKYNFEKEKFLNLILNYNV